MPRSNDSRGEVSTIEVDTGDQETGRNPQDSAAEDSAPVWDVLIDQHRDNLRSSLGTRFDSHPLGSKLTEVMDREIELYFMGFAWLSKSIKTPTHSSQPTIIVTQDTPTCLQVGVRFNTEIRSSRPQISEGDENGVSATIEMTEFGPSFVAHIEASEASEASEADSKPTQPL